MNLISVRYVAIGSFAVRQVRRGCLFCRHDHVGKLAAYFDHLAHQHNFSVGRPENLVFGLQMVDALEAKLEALRCLFCDGCFQVR